MGKLKFEVVHAETDHVCVRGKRFRSPTVLIRVHRSAAISRNVLVLGALLITCHLADGFLTFVGISQLGHSGEGNQMLRSMAISHGTIPAIFIAKSFGVVLTLVLMWLSHSRRWLRPALTGAILFYVTLALVPWLIVFAHNY